jgi:hypothetical protein
MKKRNLWNYIWPTIALSLVCFSKPLTKRVTSGFMVHKILCRDPLDPQWTAEPLEAEDKIRGILNQKFYLLGKGGQSFAFSSEDGQYVIKFLNQKQYKSDHLYNRNRGITCIYTAFQELKEDTGLLMIHFSSEKPLNQSVVLIDGCKIAHKIDLDRVQFQLQKRMKMPFDLIKAAMNNGNEDEAKGYIAELFNFVHKRLDQGILDNDSKLYTNYGFIDKRAYQLDCGQVSKAKNIAEYKNDLRQFQIRNRRFHRIIKEKYPSLLPYYLTQVESLENHYQRILQEPSHNVEQ